MTDSLPVFHPDNFASCALEAYAVGSLTIVFEPSFLKSPEGLLSTGGRSTVLEAISAACYSNISTDAALFGSIPTLLLGRAAAVAVCDYWNGRHALIGSSSGEATLHRVSLNVQGVARVMAGVTTTRAEFIAVAAALMRLYPSPDLTLGYYIMADTDQVTSYQILNEAMLIAFGDEASIYAGAEDDAVWWSDPIQGC